MSSQSSNSEWQLVKKPDGVPKPSDFKLDSTAVPTLSDCQILLRSRYVSVDPYLRNVMDSSPVNQPISSYIVAEVIESKSSDYKVGDIVTQVLPWRRLNAITPDPSKGLRKVDPSWGPISTALGVLGMPGQTAYFGLFETASFNPEKDKTVLVSGAAGAVGSLVVQLAKSKGATVIGVAGGKEKTDYVKSLGADYVIDYKAHKTREAVQAELKKAAPNGIDVYFDNTGGHVTEAVWDLLNKFGRVAICGQISMYNSMKDAPDHPNFLFKLIYKSITVRGYVVADYAKEFGRFFKEVPPLLKEGKVKFEETVTDGFDKIPEAFIGLFHGANTGKAVVKVE